MNDKNILIITVGILIVCFLILILLKGCSSKKKVLRIIRKGLYFNRRSDDPNRVVVSNKNLNKEQCVGNICIRNLKNYLLRR